MKNYAGILMLLVIGACSNSPSTKEAHKDEQVQVKQTSGSVQLEDSKTQLIYDKYVALKNALVSSNFESAKTAASALQEDLAAYEGCENTSLIAKKIGESKDLATQRKEFTYLSSDVIAMFTHATLKKGPIYVQHCPMANKGEGGYWLSSEKKIENPYYGEEMMECGEVTQEFKASI
jgi:hypothetical protein